MMDPTLFAKPRREGWAPEIIWRLLRQVAGNGDVAVGIPSCARDDDLAVGLNCHCGNERRIGTPETVRNSASRPKGAVELTAAEIRGQSERGCDLILIRRLETSLAHCNDVAV